MAFKKKGSFWRAVLWQIGLSLTLFWFPLLGTLIAGIVGGTKAKKISTAIWSALFSGIILSVPTILLSALLFGLLAKIPLIGFIFSTVAYLQIFFSLGTIIILGIGSLIGAAISR